jgi:hypothetical protein
VPFLTDRFLTDPEQLRCYVPLGWTPFPPPSVPVRDDVKASEATEAVVASDAAVATEAPVATPDEVVPVWQALLDVRVWRSRPWWWRLAASVVVKRLNR